MDIHERFSVPSAPPAVWAIMSDPRAVVGCVPGASLGEQRDDGSFDASATVKFGPLKVVFQAQVSLELDDANMRGRVSARGKDNQGGTRVASTMQFTVSAAASGSAIAVDSEVEISGKLAGLIEGGASIVVSRMSAEFAANLAARCANDTAHAGDGTLREKGDTG